MKLKEACLNISEEAYHELPVLSYSVLSRYDRDGYAAIKTLFEKQSSSALTYGSLVDALLTNTQEEFDKRFTIFSFELPTGSIAAITERLAKERPENSLDDVPDTDILVVLNEVGYYSNLKDPTRIKKIREGASAYYDFLKKSAGKTVISPDMYEDALSARQAFMGCPATRKYFTPTEGVDIIYQLQIQSTDPITGIPFKGMLDLVYIDHKNKTIYPCDIKTTQNVYNFEESFYKYRYYLQAAMYTALLKLVIIDKCSEEYSDYKIAPYRFLVIDSNTFQPIVFEWEVSDNVKDKYGNIRKSWRDLLKEVTWSLENSDLRMPFVWHEEIQKNNFITLKHY